MGIIRLIGQNTFKGAIRQKFYPILILLSVALVISSSFFQQFNFGLSELRFIADFCLGSFTLFGTVIAIVATVQLFFHEMEQRTVFNILAKPVSRTEFIIGKFTGISLLLGIFSLVLLGVFTFILLWRQNAILLHSPSLAEFVNPISLSGILLLFFVEFVKLCLIASISLWIASFSSSAIYSIMVSFLYVLICNLQYIAHDYWTHIQSQYLQNLIWGLSLLFPNLQLFNIGDALIFGINGGVPIGIAFEVILYGLAYVSVFLCLAVYSFRQRELV